MRIQLASRARAQDREAGAVALLSAALAVVLIVLAAFTVDFGMAYNSKQRLQTGADAGALAAAQVYKLKTEDCDDLVADEDLETLAQAAADKWGKLNRDGDTAGSPVEVECNGDGELSVTYATSGSTDVVFGKVAISDETIETGRVATATIGRIKAGNMRPWGICSNVAITSGQVVFVPMYKSSTTDQDAASLCGAVNPPGGWWVAQCTGQGNGTGITEDVVAAGCPTTNYTAVPGQPSTGPANLYSYLKSKCPAKTFNSTCLSSDQGNNFHETSDEWQTLVGETFTMPVFCVSPTCSQLAVDGTGNNASYAIHRLAEVELCGAELMPRAPSTNWPTEGPCATSNPRNYESGDVTSGAGLFVVVKRLYGGPVSDWKINEYRALRLTQ